MALTFVKRSTVPVAMKGKEGTTSVMVGGNGSITFSTKATKALGEGTVKIAIAFDADSRKLLIVPKGAKAVAKLPDSEFFDLRQVKGGTSAISGGGSFLKSSAVFGTALYDYAKSGNQSFDVTVEKEGISFTLPAGSLTARPVVHRVKKVKAAATVANPGSTVGTPVAANGAVVQEEELVLEPA
jgi:hypothetical protein